MQDVLKNMIEQYGVFAVLDQLSGICGQKAELLDEHEADWKTAEEAIDAAASKILDIELKT